MYPVIQTAIASQRISELRAEAARAAQARTARQARAARQAPAARAARQDRSPRLAWLFDLADRRGAARLTDTSTGLCCPDYLLTGQCAAHTGAHRMPADSSGRP